MYVLHRRLLSALQYPARDAVPTYDIFDQHLHRDYFNNVSLTPSVIVSFAVSRTGFELGHLEELMQNLALVRCQEC
jgi:hypothetical protein